MANSMFKCDPLPLQYRDKFKKLRDLTDYQGRCRKLRERLENVTMDLHQKTGYVISLNPPSHLLLLTLTPTPPPSSLRPSLLLLLPPFIPHSSSSFLPSSLTPTPPPFSLHSSSFFPPTCMYMCSLPPPPPPFFTLYSFFCSPPPPPPPPREIPAALPYIGAFLDQIYSLEMSTPTYSKDGLVNFAKMTKVRMCLLVRTHVVLG